MKRIDELFGIVCGINYDGIINEKEIKMLSHWVSENSNEKGNVIAQAVDLLRDILEDEVITEEEREKLFAFIELYRNRDKDIYHSYFVLNGIIAGIASDQKINYEEAVNLKQWLSENTELQGISVYDKTKKLIEDVLEDDYISDEEHEELLRTFQEVTDEYKDRTKIEAIKRKIARHENIGLDVIDLVDNKDVLDTIHFEAMRQLERVINSYSGLGDEKTVRSVFLSLAVIALTTYDGSFYPHVENQYDAVYHNYSSQRVNSIIRELIARYMPKNLEHGGRIINYVMMNSLVPAYYLPDYYAFLFDIYRLNFGYTLTDTVYEDLSFVFDGLKDRLSEDSDDLELNVTKKTYKLTKATKCVIQNEDSQAAIIQLSKKLLEIIEKTYWDDLDPQFENSYYKNGYEEWQKSLKDKEDERGKRRSETGRARWTPAFVFQDGKVWLSPPMHNVHGIDDYSAISIKVYSGDSLISEDNLPEIYEIIGGYQVHAKNIIINNPLGDIRYVLCEGEKIIFDSQDRLFKQFIMFDEKGNEVRNNHSYEGDVYIVHKDASADIELIDETDHFRLSMAHGVDEETVIYLGDHVISFTEEVRPGIEGTTIARQYLQCQDSSFPVYSDIKCISFESKEEPDNIGIQINNKRIRMNDLQFVRRTRGLFAHYQVDLDITEPGVYDINAFGIRDGKSLRNASFSIALDPEFTIETLQIDDDQFLVDVKSSLVESDCYELDLEGVETLSLPIKGSVDRSQLLIDVGIPAYHIDSMGWCAFSEALWIGDIKSTSVIELKGDNFLFIRINDKYKNTLDELQLQERNGFYSCQIGSLVSYQAEHDYLVLEFHGSEGLIKKTNCYNKCILDRENTHIYNDPTTDVIKINASFLGRGTVGYRIVNQNGVTVLESNKLNTDCQLVVKKLHPLKTYDLNYFEVMKGFSLKKERELGTVALCSFSFEDLVGVIASIPLVEYEQYSKKNDVLERYEWTLENTYVKFTKYLGNGKFRGRILRKRDGRFWKIRGADHVEIEYLGEPRIYILDAAITNEGDGLLLDFARNTVHMDYDDPKAVDIYSYTIDLKGADNE